jgi:hypothetical protein
MNSNKQDTTRFLEYLALLFIGLKLTGYIDWNWWVVLAPIWVPFTVVAVIAFVIAFGVQVGKARGRA